MTDRHKKDCCGQAEHGKQAEIRPFSTITCPQCGHAEREKMPTNACQFFYYCKGCGARLKAKKGDCCVYCSYGDVPCPPIQLGRLGQGDGCCS